MISWIQIQSTNLRGAHAKMASVVVCQRDAGQLAGTVTSDQSRAK